MDSGEANLELGLPVAFEGLEAHRPQPDAALPRLLSEWAHSSAAARGHFCDHWVIGLREHLDSGSLQQVLPDWVSPGEPLHIYYPGRRNLPVGLRLLIELIRELRPLGF